MDDSILNTNIDLSKPHVSPFSLNILITWKLKPHVDSRVPIMLADGCQFLDGEVTIFEKSWTMKLDLNTSD